MRRLLYIIMCGLVLTACEFETSDNGDLDGYWQWTAVDTLPSGGTCDMRSTLIFWAVEGDLLEIRDNAGKNLNVFFRFSHSGDSLTLYNPVIDKRDSSDIVLNDHSLLLPYAITSMPETFHVDQLNVSKMVLRNPDFSLSFRKY